MSEPTPEHTPSTISVKDRFREGQVSEGRFHDGDVRVAIAIALFFVFATAWGFKIYYASLTGFNESCNVEKFFDPLIDGVFGALITIIGFYFGDRRHR